VQFYGGHKTHVGHEAPDDEDGFQPALEKAYASIRASQSETSLEANVRRH